MEDFKTDLSQVFVSSRTMRAAGLDHLSPTWYLVSHTKPCLIVQNVSQRLNHLGFGLEVPAPQRLFRLSQRLQTGPGSPSDFNMRRIHKKSTPQDSKPSSARLH